MENNVTYTTNNQNGQYELMKPFAYVGYNLLYAIPVIGLIIAIINACDDTKLNRRNHARGTLWMLLISFAISFVLVGLSATLFFAITSNF